MWVLGVFYIVSVVSGARGDPLTPEDVHNLLKCDNWEIDLVDTLDDVTYIKYDLDKDAFNETNNQKFPLQFYLPTKTIGRADKYFLNPIMLIFYELFPSMVAMSVLQESVNCLNDINNNTIIWSESDIIECNEAAKELLKLYNISKGFTSDGIDNSDLFNKVVSPGECFNFGILPLGDSFKTTVTAKLKSSTTPTQDSDSDGLSTGAIIGIVIGCTVFVIGVYVVFQHYIRPMKSESLNSVPFLAM